jgi:hypothetical protein
MRAILCIYGTFNITLHLFSLSFSLTHSFTLALDLIMRSRLRHTIVHQLTKLYFTPNAICCLENAIKLLALENEYFFEDLNDLLILA